MFLNGKKTYLIPAISFLFFSFILFSSPVLATDTATPDPTKTNYGLKNTMEQGELNSALIKSTPTSIAGTVIGAILSLVGVVFFLLIFYGGLLWMIARGNDQEVEKAKNILIAATIGLVIVLAAYAITAFIGQQLTTTG